MSATESVLKALAPLAIKYLPTALELAGAFVVAKLLPKLHAWLDSGAQKNKAIKILAVAEHLAEACAGKVIAEMKLEIAAAASDGVLTPEELKALRDSFVAHFKAALGEEGKAALQDALGLAGDFFAKYLDGVAAKMLPASPR